MSAPNLLVVVKASYLLELRRLSYPKASEVKYNDLYGKLSEIFSIRDTFRLSYIDDEEDELTVANDYDLQEAIRYFEQQNNGKNITVRLTLKKDDQKPAQLQHNLASSTSTFSLVRSPSVASSFTDSTFSSRLQQKPQEDPPVPRLLPMGFSSIDDLVGHIAQQPPASSATEKERASSNTTPIVASKVPSTPVIPVVPVEEEVPAGPVSRTETPAPTPVVIPTSKPAVPLPTRVIPSPTLPIVVNDAEVAKADEKASKVAAKVVAQQRATQISAQQPQQPAELVTHNGVMCDCCFNIVRGMRWKCDDCRDYDLCQACKSTNKHNHFSTHKFSAIPYPRGRVPAPVPVNPQTHGPAHTQAQRIQGVVCHQAQCDFCESIIKGIRHKCINCPDFDLCNSCIALAATQHPDHTFMQITRPGHPEIKVLNNVAHPGVRCDACEKWIYGVRYKCVNCVDYDLCGNCEASPLTKHETSHVFLKVKTPFPRPISITRPLLPNLYAWDPANYKNHLRCGIRQPGSGSGCNRPPHAPYWVYPGHRGQTSDSPNVATTAMAATLTSAISLTAPPQTVTLVPLSPQPKPAEIEPQSQSQPQPQPSAVLIAESKPEAKAMTESICPAMSEITPPSVPETPVAPIPRPPSVASSVAIGLNLNARFVEDVNIPDGAAMQPQARFLKIWKMLNSGEEEWPQGTQLSFCGGDRMFSEAWINTNDEYSFAVPATQPGKEVFITADLQAPAEPGHYVSYWRLVAPDGSRFGHRVWCDIIVEREDVASSVSSSMIFPTINPFVSHTQSASRAPSVVSESARTHTSVETRSLMNEDPFQDPPSYPASLLCSNSERTPTGSVSIRSLNESDDDDTDDAASAYSAATSDRTDFVVVDAEEQQQDQVHPVIPSRVSRLIVEEDDQEDEDLFGTQSEVRPLMETYTTANTVEDFISNLQVPEMVLPIADVETVRTVNIAEIVANTPEPVPEPYAAQMQKLRDMGFFSDQARDLLTAYNGDLESVIAALLGF